MTSPNGSRVRTPDVSVITIFRNEERFLADAVASVVTQEGPSWELLLVDDGSTDAGPALAEQLVANDPERIRLLAHPGRMNLGMSASRNLGIAAATGRWLTFLDADDVWLPGKLRHQISALEAHPRVRVLASPAQWWCSWDGGGPEDHVQQLGNAQIVAPPSLLRGFLRDEWLSICDLVIAREAAVDLGGYEAEFAGMFEDQVFHAKIFAALPTLVTAGWWYRYRQHADACTTAAHAAGGHADARHAYLTWLGAYLAATHPEATELRRLVGRLGRRYRYPRLWRVAALAGRVRRPVQP